MGKQTIIIKRACVYIQAGFNEDDFIEVGGRPMKRIVPPDTLEKERVCCCCSWLG